MKNPFSYLLIFSASVVISLGLARLSMPIGDSNRVEPDDVESVAPVEEVVVDDGTPGILSREPDQLQRSCRNGYSWACRVLEEQRSAGTHGEQAKLESWCAGGGACFCVQLARLRDGRHTHWSATRALARGCAAGSGFACAHAGARLLAYDRELGRQMLVRACDLEPAADGCRLLGQYLVNEGSAGAKVAFERGCGTGDGRACLALARMDADRAEELRGRASELLSQTCFRRPSPVGPRCGGASESVRFAACGELAYLRLDDGHARGAHALVRWVAEKCDEQEARHCDLAEFLPVRLLERPRWDRWCDDGDRLACRVVDSRSRSWGIVATR